MIWYEPMGSTRPDGPNGEKHSGELSESRLNSTWEEWLAGKPNPKWLWFPVGFTPAHIIKMCTVTDGRAKAEPRLQRLIDTFQDQVVLGGHTGAAYLGCPIDDPLLVSQEAALDNLRPFRGFQFVLDHCAQAGPEWHGQFLKLQQWSKKVLVLEGVPQREGFEHLLQFGACVTYPSMRRPGPNGMTWEEFEDAPYPEKYCIIRGDADLGGEDRHDVLAALDRRGVIPVTRW